MKVVEWCGKLVWLFKCMFDMLELFKKIDNEVVDFKFDVFFIMKMLDYCKNEICFCVEYKDFLVVVGICFYFGCFLFGLFFVGVNV